MQGGIIPRDAQGMHVLGSTEGLYVPLGLGGQSSTQGHLLRRYISFIFLLRCGTRSFTPVKTESLWVEGDVFESKDQTVASAVIIASKHNAIVESLL